MSIQVEWDNEAHTVVLYTFIGDWTWDELYASLDQGEAMARDSTIPVSAVIDMRQASSLPGGSVLNLRDHAQTLVSRAQADRGQIAVVGASLLFRTLFGSFSKVFADKAGDVTFADSMDEARRVVGETT